MVLTIGFSTPTNDSKHLEANPSITQWDVRGHEVETNTPSTIDEVTPGWLTFALRQGGYITNSKVVRTRNRPIGEFGFLSTVLHVLLEYDHPEPKAPASLVVKLEPSNQRLHDLTDKVHAFEREIRFYREVAPLASIRLPRCYYAAMGPPNYVLVMEDLTAATPCDQVAGLHAPQVIEIARLIGRLQGKYWNNNALAQLTWMPTANYEFWDHFDSRWDLFVEKFGSSLNEPARQLGERLRGKSQWLKKEIECRPRTLVHSDLRADNILLGPPGTPESTLILDWQLVIRSIGAFDVARLMGGSELPQERQGHQLDVLRAWFDAVCESDVDYHWEDAQYDLRLGFLIMFCWAVRLYNIYCDSQGRPRELVQCICERVFDSAIEMDTVGILPPA